MRTRGWKVSVWPAGLQALARIAHSPAVGGSGSAASIVTMKLLEALPPELVAVTVTSVPGSGAAVGIETRPVASTVAPAPVTLKRKVSPTKSAPASMSCGPVPSSKTSSSSRPLAVGAG